MTRTELTKEVLDKMSDEDRALAVQDAIKLILETLAPDLNYFMLISKENQGLLFGNSCPLYAAEKLIYWIEDNGITHDSDSPDEELPTKVM